MGLIEYGLPAFSGSKKLTTLLVVWDRKSSRPESSAAVCEWVKNCWMMLGRL